MFQEFDSSEASKLRRRVNNALRDIEDFLERGHPDFRTLSPQQVKDLYSMKEQLIYNAWHNLKGV